MLNFLINVLYSTVSSCTHEAITENEMQAEDEPFPIVIATEKIETVSEIVIEENYPDYEDDYNSSKIVSNVFSI